MTFSEIHHVDVVTHARPVRGGPVAAEHLELCSAAYSHLTHKGKEVVGDAQRVFSNAAGRMGANWVEIAQASYPPGVWGTCVKIIQHLLHSGLCVAVGIDRRDGSCLWNRYGFWVAVERGATAEHKGMAAKALHGFQQAATSIHIHIPVMKRLLHRLSNSFKAGEMDHRINPERRLGKGLLKIPGVANVAVHLSQPRRGHRPSELAHTFKSDRAAVAEIVEDQQLVARFQQCHRGMAADEACSSGDQQLCHRVGLAVTTHHPPRRPQVFSMPSLSLIVLV